MAKTRGEPNRLAGALFLGALAVPGIGHAKEHKAGPDQDFARTELRAVKDKNQFIEASLHNLPAERAKEIKSDLDSYQIQPDGTFQDKYGNSYTLTENGFVYDVQNGFGVLHNTSIEVEMLTPVNTSSEQQTASEKLRQQKTLEINQALALMPDQDAASRLNRVIELAQDKKIHQQPNGTFADEAGNIFVLTEKGLQVFFDNDWQDHEVGLKDIYYAESNNATDWKKSPGYYNHSVDSMSYVIPITSWQAERKEDVNRLASQSWDRLSSINPDLSRASQEYLSSGDFKLMAGGDYYSDKVGDRKLILTENGLFNFHDNELIVFDKEKGWTPQSHADIDVTDVLALAPEQEEARAWAESIISKLKLQKRADGNYTTAQDAGALYAFMTYEGYDNPYHAEGQYYYLARVMAGDIKTVKQGEEIEQNWNNDNAMHIWSVYLSRFLNLEGYSGNAYQREENDHQKKYPGTFRINKTGCLYMEKGKSPAFLPMGADYENGWRRATAIDLQNAAIERLSLYQINTEAPTAYHSYDFKGSYNALPDGAMEAVPEKGNKAYLPPGADAEHGWVKPAMYELIKKMKLVADPSQRAIYYAEGRRDIMYVEMGDRLLYLPVAENVEAKVLIIGSSGWQKASAEDLQQQAKVRLNMKPSTKNASLFNAEHRYEMYEINDHGDVKTAANTSYPEQWNCRTGEWVNE